MRFINLLLIGILLTACKKDKPEDAIADTPLKQGMLVLCEGLFQQNNASVSWVNRSDLSVRNDFFEAKTLRGLGDTGNDMQRYGGKIYIVVNISSTVEVMSASDFTPLKQISMISGGTSKQPRSLAFYGGKAYVTCYDGFVDVIDTTSLTVVQRIPVGLNPEGLAVSGQRLYVANSGGLNSPLMDSTVSVIDLTSHTEIDRITVGLNPGGVVTDGDGEVYVIARGNYGSVPSRMVRIDTQSNSVAQEFTFDASGIARMQNKFLVSYYDFSSGQANVALFDPQSEQVENGNYIDLSGVTTLYGVQYDAAYDRIYCLDAMSFTNTGYVHEYNSSGSLIRSYHVGLNPSKILFYD